MSTPLPPPPVRSINIDPGALKRQIDSAVASLQKDEHLAVLFKVNQDGASAAAIGQILDGHLRAMAKITKPWGSVLGWEVGVGASFAVGRHQPAELEDIPVAALVYCLRHPSWPLEANGKWQAWIKAIGFLIFGRPIYPDGRRWFAKVPR